MKMYCSFEIEDAIENSGKYDLATLAAMRKQMLKHEEHLTKEYEFLSEIKAGLKADIVLGQIREQKNNIQKMEANIIELAA